MSSSVYALCYSTALGSFGFRVCYLRQGGYVFVVVCLSVCQSVCLFVCQQLCSKTSELNCMKFSGKVGNRPTNKWLNFGGDPNHRLGLFSDRLHTVSYDHIRLPLMNSVSIESARPRTCTGRPLSKQTISASLLTAGARCFYRTNQSHL